MGAVPGLALLDSPVSCLPPVLSWNLCWVWGKGQAPSCPCWLPGSGGDFGLGHASCLPIQLEVSLGTGPFLPPGTPCTSFPDPEQNYIREGNSQQAGSRSVRTGCLEGRAQSWGGNGARAVATSPGPPAQGLLPSLGGQCLRARMGLFPLGPWPCPCPCPSTPQGRGHFVAA